jgi:hypothetical protein
MEVRMRSLVLGLATLVAAASASAADMPIFDAHLHYSHDAWSYLSPKDAVALLKKAGIKRALVSSSNDEGTQKLMREAPDLILPELRPYRRRGEQSTWFKDESVVGFLEDRLRRSRYVAIGEFHLYGADADLPVPRRMVELARQHELFLHAHSDVDAIERLFRQDPNARILWAHSGFERPEVVRAMLRKYPNLVCDLAFRSEHGSGGKVPEEWRAAFMEFPDRFMVGTDTFTPERWPYVTEHAAWSRAWLGDLPQDVAERIGYRNGDKIFGPMLDRRTQ